MASKRDIRIEIRLKARESRAWREAARRSDLTLSEWIRRMCNVGASSSPPPEVPVADQVEAPLCPAPVARSDRR